MFVCQGFRSSDYDSKVLLVANRFPATLAPDEPRSQRRPDMLPIANDGVIGSVKT